MKKNNKENNNQKKIYKERNKKLLEKCIKIYQKIHKNNLNNMKLNI